MNKIIVTHDGKFHTDEVIAIWFLRHVYPQNTIIRTRDPNIINGADIVVDVGGVYLPDKDRFDHHQSTFNLTFPGSTIPLSSAGIVWLKYGRELIKDHFGPKFGMTLTEKQIETAFIELYHTIVKEIDGNDNGVPQYIVDGRMKFNYNVNLSMIGIITAFNGQNINDAESQYILFNKAINACDLILVRIEKCLGKIICYDNDLIKTYQIIEDSKKVDPTGAILIAEAGYIQNLKKCLKAIGHSHVNYTIVQGNTEIDEWIVKAMPAKYKQYKSKKDILPHKIINILKADIIPRIKYIANPGYFAKVIGLNTAIELAKLSLQYTFRRGPKLGEYFIDLSEASNNSMQILGRSVWVTLSTLEKIYRMAEFIKSKGYLVQLFFDENEYGKIKCIVTNPGVGTDTELSECILRDYGISS